jgi:putative sigma-54 modulation protein
MRIHITARRFKLSEELKQYAETEVYRLKKYYEPIIDVDIILSWEKKNRIAEINMKVFGTILTSHDRSEDMRKSVVRAVDKLERQLKKYKDRRHGFNHDKIGAEPAENNREAFSVKTEG